MKGSQLIHWTVERNLLRMTPMSMPAGNLWETTNDDDGNPEFRDVCTRGMTVDHIAVGTARKEDRQFAEGLDAWATKTTIRCKCDTWDEQCAGHDGSHIQT